MKIGVLIVSGLVVLAMALTAAPSSAAPITWGSSSITPSPSPSPTQPPTGCLPGQIRGKTVTFDSGASCFVKTSQGEECVYVTSGCSVPGTAPNVSCGFSCDKYNTPDGSCIKLECISSESSACAKYACQVAAACSNQTRCRAPSAPAGQNCSEAGCTPTPTPAKSASASPSASSSGPAVF